MTVEGKNGASNKSGRLSGVQARITVEYSDAIFIHCFYQPLKLAVQDCSKKILMMTKALNTIQKLSNLHQFSS